MTAVDTPAKPSKTEKVFASREDFLSQAGKFNEEELTVPGLGVVLVSEVSADIRAEIMSDQSVVLLAEGVNRKLDRKSYERKLLLAGVLDPNSPENGRLPLFQRGDLDKVMQIGGAKIGDVVDAIERLSLLGRYAASAEGNSNGSQNSAGT